MKSYNNDEATSTCTGPEWIVTFKNGILIPKTKIPWSRLKLKTDNERVNFSASFRNHGEIMTLKNGTDKGKGRGLVQR